MIPFERHHVRARAAIGLVIAVALLAGCGGEQAQQMTPPLVTVDKPVVRDVTPYDDFTGRTEAVRSVEIRARVEGFLESIEFQEGSGVEEGDLLFVIDPEPYEAARDEAAARLAAAEAELEQAASDLERVLEAAQTDAVSQQEVTAKTAGHARAEAGLLQAKAALLTAELNLGYCWVRSPIEGRAGRSMMDVGDLVGGLQRTLLTTVVDWTPIQVYFDVSETKLLRLLGREYEFEGRGLGVHPVFVARAGEDGYPHEGVIDWIDNQIDSATGTVLVRGELPNRNHLFVPGMFVSVRVPGTTQMSAVLAEERAIGTDLAGKYLLVVGEGNVVENRPVKIGALYDGMRVIEDGISPYETYIVNGLQRARPGLPVTPEEAQADDSGEM
jgi:RND family efflux transporter MFP subunit